ncbi:MAG: hypothetical protein Q9M17_10925 [Mariprofundus sp.]|nr:hypothetical protein [Mariprofundus sp.]
MIIVPTATPAAVLDQNTVNQTQQYQTQSAEQSRKASVTVQVSAEARELAGAESKEPAPQQKIEVQANKENIQAVEVNKQQAVNQTTKLPENNKIDVVA